MRRSLSVPEPGTRLGDHVVVRVEPFPEIQGSYIELKHEAIGARHIHVAAPDENNMFSVLFPTVPTDSTGVAHILEHVALMGSERYDVHGTFYKMGPRSLNTFLNASTSPDTTQYYFTTRNEKDYFNLLSVYLDAAFFPKLDELTFKQEGHRLEFATMDDPSSDLTFKGVVFNEMKGQMSTPAYLALRSISQAMFPDLTYANNSGGDPEFIPDLTWEQLKAFHARHYHPSNSYFFTYGDLPLQDILPRIQEHVLSRFAAQPIDVSVPDQPRYEAPKSFAFRFPLAKDRPLERQSQVTVAWLTCMVTDPVETLSMEVLSDVLLSNASSPLRKALVESKFGEALSDGSGFLGFFREGVFAAGLKGTDPDKAAQIEKLVLETLEKIVKEGLDPEAVEAALHRTEIDSKEVSNAGAPFSLKLFSMLRSGYIYGGDPYEAMRIDIALNQIKSRVAAGGWFEDCIRRWLLDAPHRATIVLSPDHDLQDARDSREKQRLARVRSSLSQEQIDDIVATAIDLKAKQDEEQDLSALPTLGLSDLPTDLEDVDHTIVDEGSGRLGLFPQPTNDLSYVSLRTAFDGLSDDQVDLLSVYTYALSRSGAGDRDYLQLALAIDAVTGGIRASASTRVKIDGSWFRNFTLRAKSLTRNHSGLFAIVQDLIAEPRFEASRLRQIVDELKTQRESSLLMSGHSYAMGLAAASLTAEASIGERLGGVSLIRRVKELATSPDGRFVELVTQLEAIGRKLWSGNLTACLTSTPEAMESLSERARALRFPGTVDEGHVSDPRNPEPVHSARTTSTQVAYNARAYLTDRIGGPLAPATHVLSAHMRSKFLLRELRQKGGAYGAGTTYNRESGTFTFYTYRDPNIAESFATFDSAIVWAGSHPPDGEDLKEAILSAYKSVDPLMSPDTKGTKRFFDDIAGYSLDVQRRYRGSLLAVTPDEVADAAKALASSPSAMATISGEDKVLQAQEAMGNVFEVSPV